MYFYGYICESLSVSGIVSVKTETAIRATQLTVEERRLFRCLTCDALTEYQVSPDLFDKTGSLYKLAVATYGALRTDKKYKFPLQGDCQQIAKVFLS